MGIEIHLHHLLPPAATIVCAAKSIASCNNTRRPLEKRISTVSICRKFLLQIVFPARVSAVPGTPDTELCIYVYMQLQLPPAPCHMPPPHYSILSGSHFRSFCVVHFTSFTPNVFPVHLCESWGVTLPGFSDIISVFSMVYVCWVFFYVPQLFCGPRPRPRLRAFFCVWIMPFWHFLKLFRSLQAGVCMWCSVSGFQPVLQW